MGIVEGIVLFIYAIGSTAGNIYQSNQNGKLQSEVKRYKSVAALCSHNGQRERRNTVLEANNRAVTEEQNANSLAEYQQGVSMAFQTDSGPCVDASAGNLPGSLVDAERRLVEELREHRMQSEPIIVLPEIHTGASED